MSWTPQHSYIEVVVSQNLTLSAVERAEGISRCLHRMVNGDSDMLMFSIFEHPISGRALMVADVNKPIPVNSTASANDLISLVDTSANQQERDGFLALIQQSGYITLGDILPHGTNYLTYEQLQYQGWFEE